ncbi:MAG: hypothetical protein HYS22_03625 [Deltaproteobacteria bacterium]|nr:hypothetical protein [Deltaproteobacteria bacterium]
MRLVVPPLLTFEEILKRVCGPGLEAGGAADANNPPLLQASLETWLASVSPQPISSVRPFPTHDAQSATGYQVFHNDGTSSYQTTKGYEKWLRDGHCPPPPPPVAVESAPSPRPVLADAVGADIERSLLWESVVPTFAYRESFGLSDRFGNVVENAVNRFTETAIAVRDSANDAGRAWQANRYAQAAQMAGLVAVGAVLLVTIANPAKI